MDSAVDKPDSVRDEMYDLFGVVIHSGHSTSSGHYYSYCKTSQDKWFECDDSSIRASNESFAL
jgi:ubiquitin carboxyl-terminal hydrolase 36/42